MTPKALEVSVERILQYMLPPPTPTLMMPRQWGLLGVVLTQLNNWVAAADSTMSCVSASDDLEVY